VVSSYSEELAVKLAAVFVVGAWHVDHAPHTALASNVTCKLREKCRSVQTIRLGLSASTISLNAR